MRTKLLLFVSFIGTCLFAQDMHFSQYYESPMQLNPALCGAFKGGLLAEVDYRNQWDKLAGSAGFNAMTATFELHNLEQNWSRGYLATGLSFYKDQGGSSKVSNTGAALTFGSGIYVSQNSAFSAGIQGGFSQFSVNSSDFQWGTQFINQQYDPGAPSGEASIRNSLSYMDFSGGVLYSFAFKPVTQKGTESRIKFNVGLGVFHLNEPDISYFNETSPGSKLYMRTTAHGSFQFPLGMSPISLAPSFVYYLQGPSKEMDAGLKIRYDISEQNRFSGFGHTRLLDLGIYDRLNDALIVMSGLDFDTFSAGVSYDVNTSPLSSATYGKGAFELSLKFNDADIFSSKDSRRHQAF